MEFKTCKLRDIATIVMGQSPKGTSYNNKCTGKEFLQGNRTFGRIYPKIDTWTTEPKKIAKEKSILMSVRAPVGELNIANREICIGRGLCAIEMKNKNNKYLFYLLKHSINKIKRKSSGTVFDSINKTELENIEVIDFDKETQDKITSILFSIDKKIELNSQINDNLQNLINNLFIKFFVKFDTYKGNYKESDLGLIPESFEVDKLGNVISFSNGYSWNSKDMMDNYINNSYKVFKMGNINIGGGINKSKIKSWIIKDKVQNLEQYISKKGDILMCMTDMKNSGNPLLGHTALIDKDDEFVINQRVGILRCDKIIGYSYIYTMSNMPDFINDIRSRANSGVQVNLTTKGIYDTLILVPDSNILSEFENVAVPLYEQIFTNNNENESLEELRDTLLPKLMNGEIDLDKIEI